MTAYKLHHTSSRRWAKPLLFIGLVGIFLAIALAVGLKSLYERNLQAVDPGNETSVVFVVETGSSVAEIADKLQESQLIRSSRAFNQYVRSKNLGESFIAGTYSLSQSYDVPTIVNYLVEGKVDKNLFTILPGQSLKSIRQAFIDNGGFSETAVDAALKPSRYADHPALVDKPAGASLEGYLYPDSYEKIAGTKPETIIRQSLDEMAAALTPDIRAGFAAHGLSVYEGIILASIVEKEVGSNEDRAKAAQVFLKRLQVGMMLQSNTTDEFPAEYDTYSIAALPPGPISNVTVSSLNAVVKPAQTDFLFFVSGEDCITRFSSTQEEHEVLINKHGVAKDCRG